MKLIQATTTTAPDGAIRVSATVYLVDEETAQGFPEATEAMANTAAVVRNDLPATHPLRGRRLLKVVPCGSLDVEIVKGKPVQVRPDGTYLDADPPPHVVDSGEIGEVEGTTVHP
jgi:hypothetical protein